MTTLEILKRANEAKKDMVNVTEEQINTALGYMAEELISDTDKILSANKIDIENAKGKISEVMIDRLSLNADRIVGMAKGIKEIIPLPFENGKILEETKRPNGLLIQKVSVPMGVVGIIYESRPNVTSDAGALALKSGNVCVLRGGKEAYNTSRAIVDSMSKALKKSGINENAIQLIEDTTRQSATELMQARGYIDMLIPRGSKGLIDACVANATVPCLQTGTGICHIYVSDTANLDMALDILENAKTQRPSVCNACEVCLVHESIAQQFLPMLKKRLVLDRARDGKVPVEFRCDDSAFAIIRGNIAAEDDYDTEFLDYILAIKIVKSTEDAIEHIARHSTNHSEAIITESDYDKEYFALNVDSSAVYINASTRFTDGGEFGLGCEMGISTQKMHARGPMGIGELTTYKYIIRGCGQTR